MSSLLLQLICKRWRANAPEEELLRRKGAEAPEKLLADAHHTLNIVIDLANSSKFGGAGRVARSALWALKEDTDVTSLSVRLTSVTNEILAESGKQVFLRVSPDRV